MQETVQPCEKPPERTKLFEAGTYRWSGHTPCVQRSYARIFVDFFWPLLEKVDAYPSFGIGMGHSMNEERIRYLNIAEDLKGKIARRAFPGGRLPPERELAQKYGVNRLTLRKSLKMLFDEGLIAKMGVHGTFIAGKAPVLRPKTLRRIMVVLAGGSVHSPYFGRMVNTIRSELSRREIEIDFHFASRPEDLDGVLRRNLTLKAIDGMVLAGYLTPSLLLKVKKAALPCVLIGLLPKADPLETEFDQVAEDSARYASDAANILAEMGRTRIGFLDGPPQNQWSQIARKFFGAALRKKRLSPVFWINIKDESNQAGMRAAEEMLSKSPDAVFIRSEAIARGVFDSLFQRGVRIPEDLVVLTFGHPGDSISHLGLPKLEIRPELLAKSAVELLVKRFENPSGPPKRLLVRASFVK